MKAEVESKVKSIREALARNHLGGICFRGVDWFSWVTGGASNVLLMTAEIGVANAFISANDAFIFTNRIEGPRLRAEENFSGFELIEFDWFNENDRKNFLTKLIGNSAVASDRPETGELPLPADLEKKKLKLQREEVERYRNLGRESAQAMREVLSQAHPEMTELELSGLAAHALRRRGIHPALILAAGEERLPLYRHPMPTEKPLGQRAMLVFCARKSGLYANLTRFVAFSPLSPDELRRHEVVAQVEAQALRDSLADTPMHEIFLSMSNVYGKHGFAAEERNHHQGGITGYLSREIIASPASRFKFERPVALAWNPSVAGAKIEDTFLLDGESLENLTFDPEWPSFELEGRKRPAVWVRS